MLLDQGFVAMVGDGMEVEVEGSAGAEALVEAAQGVVPALAERCQRARVVATGVLGEGGALGAGVEPGEQREAVVEHGGHDAGGASDAPQLEGQQGAQGTAGGDPLGAGQAVGEAVELEPGEVGGEQEQAAEAGAEAARDRSGRGGRPAGPAARRAAAEGRGGLAWAGRRAQDSVDEGDAVRQVLLAQAVGDVVDGEILLAQCEDAPPGRGGRLLGGAAGSGSGR